MTEGICHYSSVKICDDPLGATIFMVAVIANAISAGKFDDRRPTVHRVVTRAAEKCVATLGTFHAIITVAAFG